MEPLRPDRIRIIEPPVPSAWRWIFAIALGVAILASPLFVILTMDHAVAGVGYTLFLLTPLLSGCAAGLLLAHGGRVATSRPLKNA